MPGVWDNGVRTLEVTWSQIVALMATNEAHGLTPTLLLVLTDFAANHSHPHL